MFKFFKKWKWIAGGLVLTYLIYGYGWISFGRPETQVIFNLRMPDSVIRKRLLEFTPVGTSKAQCREFLKTRLSHGEEAPSFRSDTLHGIMGHYVGGILFLENPRVDVTWEFDGKNNLKDIDVTTWVISL